MVNDWQSAEEAREHTLYGSSPGYNTLQAVSISKSM